MMIFRWLFMTKAGWIVLLVVGLTVSAYAIYNREIARAEARGEAQQLAVQVTAMRAAYDADSSAFRDSLAARQKRIDSLAARVDTAVGSVDRWRDHAIANDGVIAELLQRVDDTTATAIVAVIDTLEADLEACTDGLVACDSVRTEHVASIVLLKDRLFDADTLVRAQATTITDLQLVQRTGKGCGLAFAAGVGVLWNLTADSTASRWAVGPGVTVGLGCRI